MVILSVSAIDRTNLGVKDSIHCETDKYLAKSLPIGTVTFLEWVSESIGIVQ